MSSAFEFRLYSLVNNASILTNNPSSLVTSDIYIILDITGKYVNATIAYSDVVVHFL